MGFDASLNQPKIQIMKVASRSRLQRPKVIWRSQLIPIPPAGFFANAYSRTEIQADNHLAKVSVVRAPKDLK
jgi:hypothetical protein